MATDLHYLVKELEDNVCRVVLGKRDIVRLCLVGLLAGEHVLLEDVPGVGKTLIGKALARSVAGHFSRVQFTPDLLPSDICGSSVFHSQADEFVFHKGAIFSNFVLADETNRAPPRTQSALLEAMSDRQVSIDGTTYPLPEPFMVIATQNPFEYEGTYALPESQLDRFLLRISVGYPSREEEKLVLTSHRDGEPISTLESVLDCRQIKALQEEVRQVEVDDSINDYLLNIIAATRDSEELQIGASTRGALSLYRAAQAAAVIDERNFVVPDDVKQLAVPVLGHRVIAEGFLQGHQADLVNSIVQRLIDSISVPS